MEEKEKNKEIEQAAEKIIEYSKNSLFMKLRFMQPAISRLRTITYPKDIAAENQSFATNMKYIYYNPFYVIKSFKKNDNKIIHSILHSTLHCVFRHNIVTAEIREPLWNLACDIAVENMIDELKLDCVDEINIDAALVISRFKKHFEYITAQRIYEYLISQNISDEEADELNFYFDYDEHSLWFKKFDLSEGNGANIVESDEELIKDWEKVSKQIQADLETFSKEQGDKSGNLMQNLKELHRERYDYAEFLKKFATFGEVMQIDQDSFDTVFYTYGMELYGDMPLIEPLEYKEVKRVKEFVIAIDTSGSVMGKTVQNFLQKTFNILKQEENFFTKINIHIIQCDTKITDDAKVTNQEEIDEYLKNLKLKGFGGTDFCPVFEYVNELVKNKEFENLKGIIYFTDGYGTFPKKQPDYKTAFIFLDDECNNYDVPSWAIKLILKTEDIN